MLRSEDDTSTALVRLRTESSEPLFSPIVEVDWVAGPADCAYLNCPGVDTANATAMAHAALDAAPGARVAVIEGMYRHVNFIVDPTPLALRVVDVVPPWPAKLADMARRVIEFDQQLPPIELQVDTIDLTERSAVQPAKQYVLPCRGSGIALDAEVSFLDERAEAMDRDAVLVGCARSADFYQWFYRAEPDRIELCPRALRMDVRSTPTLLKCCYLERGIEVHGNTWVVPWGAELDEVQQALRQIGKVAASQV